MAIVKARKAKYQKMCNENQQLKKNWKNQNCFKQQQQQRRNKQQQLIQLQKELSKYKQKKKQKTNKTKRTNSKWYCEIKRIIFCKIIKK